MSITKEKDRSLIICSEYDFKRRISNLLIEAAYPAEKYTVNTPSAAIKKFEEHPEILNVIVNGADFSGKRLFILMGELSAVLKERPQTKILAFVTEEQQITLNGLEKKPYFYYEMLPVTLKSINKVFNPIKQRNTAPYKKVHNVKEKDESEKKATQTPSKNLNFYETSDHLRDAIESLKALKEDRSNMEALQHIGQRFNGVFGAFSFVQDKKGYKELLNLSHIVDDIARHYGPSSENTTISEQHFSLMLDAAKCTYILLKSLRDNKTPESADLDNYKEILKRRTDCTDIKKYVAEQQSQDEIDALLEKSIV